MNFSRLWDLLIYLFLIFLIGFTFHFYYIRQSPSLSDDSKIGEFSIFSLTSQAQINDLENYVKRSLNNHVIYWVISVIILGLCFYKFIYKEIIGKLNELDCRVTNLACDNQLDKQVYRPTLFDTLTWFVRVVVLIHIVKNGFTIFRSIACSTISISLISALVLNMILIISRLIINRNNKILL